jgi:hypothetical protein
MKNFAKLALALAIGTSFIQTASASSVYAGAPKTAVAANSKTQVVGYATVYNHTSYYFSVDATFQPHGQTFNDIPICPAGYYCDTLTYEINHPDNAVKVQIRQYGSTTEVIMPYTILYPGSRVDIWPTLTANKLPTVTVTK